MRRVGTVGGVLAAVAVMALMVVGVVMHLDRENADVQRSAEDAKPLQVHTPPPTKVLYVVGDSWTEGSDMNTGPEWWDMLGLPDNWIVQSNGHGGFGYLADNPLQEYSKTLLPEDLTRIPDVGIVALGRNDLEAPLPAVLAAADSDLRKLKKAWEPHGQLVVLSPFSPEPPNLFTQQVTAGLRKVTTRLGIPYIDVSEYLADHPEDIGSDHAHPTDAGEKLIAERMKRDLARAGIRFSP